MNIIGCLLSVLKIQWRSPGSPPCAGGQRTIQAFRQIGALGSLGLVVLPILLGDGTPLCPPGTPPLGLALESHRAFPDGSVELTYTPDGQPRE